MMTITKSSITHYFCIVPKSWVESQACGRSSPLDAFFGQKLTSANWSVLVGVRPERIEIAHYNDGESLNLCRPLCELGIFTDASKLISQDPSIYLRTFTVGEGETNENPRTVFIGFAYRVPGEPQVVTQGTEPATLVVDDFRKPTTIVIWTCRRQNQESVSAAISSLLSRYPQIPSEIFNGIPIKVHKAETLDRETLMPTGTDSLRRATIDDLRKDFPNEGRNGVLIRHFINDSLGRDVSELSVYWSKSRAMAVREVISDVEQL